MPIMRFKEQKFKSQILLDGVFLCMYLCLGQTYKQWKRKLFKNSYSAYSTHMTCFYVRKYFEYDYPKLTEIINKFTLKRLFF